MAFTAPNGVVTNLTRVDTGGVEPNEFINETLLPNTRCLPSGNAHGLAVRMCTDTIAFAQIANIVVKSADGATQLLALTTRSRGDVVIFRAMVESVRLAP
ncbi:MAG: hypothetical protein ABI874_06065 [Chloroflexota bacterium]